MKIGLGIGTATPDSPAQPFVPPTPAELAGRFPQLEVLDLIGCGGMGAVYKARQKSLNRLVALKILASGKEHDPKFAERFAREAQALAQLNHPNIVAVHDFGQANGFYYLLMEFVEGANLRQVIKERRLTPREALAIVPEICAALEFAHDRGIVHRDIKPENIILDQRGRAKIADFGIAKMLGVSAPKVALTDEQHVIGTPHYMAPEQVEHPTEVDHRADIFSLGVVFYELLTGELPLGKFPPPSARMRGVQVDVRLDEVVLRALEKEPERRYQQVHQFKTDVESIAAAQSGPDNVSSGRSLPLRPLDFKPSSFRDYWIWDLRIVWLFFAVPTILTGIATPILWPFMGAKTALLYIADGAGLLFMLMYLMIGARVRRLKRALPAGAIEFSEALFARPPFQSPGLAVLCPDRLELLPITGQPLSVPLQEISQVHETQWLNGTRLFWKTGLRFGFRNELPAAVALPRPLAARWKKILAKRAITPGPQNVALSNAYPVFWMVLILLLISGLITAGVLLLVRNLAPSGKKPAPFAAAAPASASSPPVAQPSWGVEHNFASSSFLQMPPLDLDTASALPIPATRFTRERDAFAWFAAQGADLGFGGVRGTLSLSTTISNQLRLALLTNATWAKTTPAQVNSALAAGTSGLEQIVDATDGWIACQVPTNAPSPLLFAFATTSGSQGLLELQHQLPGRQVFVRFKLLADSRAPAVKAVPEIGGPVPPVVIRTEPESGAQEVDPSLREIRVTFSKEMADGSWSWTTMSKETFPTMTAEPRYLNDARTCVLPVTLQPARCYAIWLNSEKHQNFTDTEGEPAVPYLLIFQTRK